MITSLSDSKCSLLAIIDNRFLVHWPSGGMVQTGAAPPWLQSNRRQVSEPISHPLSCLSAFACIRTTRLTMNFLQFFDSVVYGVGTTPPRPLVQEKRGFVSCNYSVTAVYELSEHAFSLEELKKNAAFYYFHMSGYLTATSLLLKNLQVIMH